MRAYGRPTHGVWRRTSPSTGYWRRRSTRTKCPTERREPSRGPPAPLWGVWSLKRATPTIAFRAEDGIKGGRITRRWAQAQRRPQTTREPAPVPAPATYRSVSHAAVFVFCPAATEAGTQSTTV